MGTRAIPELSFLRFPDNPDARMISQFDPAPDQTVIFSGERRDGRANSAYEGRRPVPEW